MHLLQLIFVNKNKVVHCLFTVYLPMLKKQLVIFINAEININQ